MFLGAGLVLTGCGDDETTTTPAPAPPPPPPPAPEPEPEPPPAPEAPATPTGLHVDETTETSITWHWNAVEGAIGYAVQVSMDEMFDANDQIVPTTETHFTASDLPPNTSVYVRVAAAAGTLEAPILSDWTTHVTGMSAPNGGTKSTATTSTGPVSSSRRSWRSATRQTCRYRMRGLTACAGTCSRTMPAVIRTTARTTRWLRCSKRFPARSFGPDGTELSMGRRDARRFAKKMTGG